MGVSLFEGTPCLVSLKGSQSNTLILGIPEKDIPMWTRLRPPATATHPIKRQGVKPDLSLANVLPFQPPFGVWVGGGVLQAAHRKKPRGSMDRTS